MMEQGDGAVEVAADGGVAGGGEVYDAERLVRAPGRLRLPLPGATRDGDQEREGTDDRAWRNQAHSASSAMRARSGQRRLPPGLILHGHRSRRELQPAPRAAHRRTQSSWTAINADASMRK